MAGRKLLYLRARDVETLMPSPGELIALLREVFLQKANGATEMPPKLGVHPKPESLMHAMPASIPSMGAVGVKWISAYPGNPALGLPQVSGLVVLNDPETGVPYAILDAAPITTTRTAAASVLAALHLARDDAETLGVLGCGEQGRSHIRAFVDAFPIQRVVALDPSEVAASHLADELSAELGLEIEIETSARRLVEVSDVVVSAGPITNPPHETIQAGWLKPGACAVSIDYGSYWHGDALREMDLSCTDDLVQLASHQREGYLPNVPPIHVELAALVAGSAAGRQTDTQKTFACNLGIAVEDVAVSKVLVDRAREQNRGLALPT